MRTIDQDSLGKQSGDNLFGGVRRLQFDGQHEPDAAHRPNHAMLAVQPFELAEEILAQLANVPE